MAKFHTAHNGNTKISKNVEIMLPSLIKSSIIEWINEEISRIKKELEKV